MITLSFLRLIVLNSLSVASRALAAWRRSREARRTTRALLDMDDHLLRDLGIARSEITSLSAELTGRSEVTRVQALLAAHL